MLQCIHSAGDGWLDSDLILTCPVSVGFHPVQCSCGAVHTRGVAVAVALCFGSVGVADTCTGKVHG
jgi:hypothetical protein